MLRGVPRALEAKPLLVAAVIGAIAFSLLRRRMYPHGLALGAAIGAAVQLGVRLAGVS